MRVLDCEREGGISERGKIELARGQTGNLRRAARKWIASTV
jgi:hypothetical protein